MAVLVVAGGIVTGDEAPRLLDPSFRGMAMACDYPWSTPEIRGTFDFLRQLPELRSRIVATPQALSLATDYLVARPDVEPRCVTALGVSLGVYPVAAWAAADSRAQRVALVQGGDLRHVLNANLERYVSSGPLRRLVTSIGARMFAPLDPSRVVGGISPRPLLIVGASADERIPREAVEKLYQVAREPKELKWMPAGHMRGPSDTVQLRSVAEVVRGWHAGVEPTCVI